jgi:hypothetical protein
MQWITSAGGPLVLVPEGMAGEWRGATADGLDYDAACAVSDYAGIIRWHGADVLVLNDEPLATTSFVAAGRLMFLRWMYAPSEAAILDLLPGIDQLLPPACAETGLVLSSRSHALFDAGAPGDRVEPILRVEVEPGRYSVQTHVWKPNADIGLLVHVLHDGPG